MVEPRELFRPDALRIDWMNRGYLPSVVAIERACVENAWLDADFVRCLRARDYFGQVALGPAGRLAGFCIYKVKPHRLRILKLAVDPHDRRRGVGSRLVSSLKSDFGGAGHGRITIEVHENNLATQLFFRALGFRCVNVLRGYYNDQEAAYLFSWRSLA